METRNNQSIDLSKEEFKQIGHKLIDDLADFFRQMPLGKVTSGESPSALQKILEQKPFPAESLNSKELLSSTTQMLAEHSLFNGHPKFMGYITSSPAPLGVLSDLLASAMNSNVGAQVLSPMATEIEKQTIGWLCELIGVPTSFGGVLVSGGNMANFTAFLAARNAKASSEFKQKGVDTADKKLAFYCSKSTHTWIDKACVLFGHGTDSVRWIEADEHNKMRLDKLEEAIKMDKQHGIIPAIVIGTAGDVSTGAVDDLEQIAVICAKHEIWFHIDGAYGAPAAVLPELASVFKGMELADSIAIDPHKWLYAPLEAGCTLVKNPQQLVNTFTSHPEYYNFSHDEGGRETNFFEYGLQNSRGFRALKVWTVLQQVGRNGYQGLIRDDVALAKYFFELAEEHPDLQAMTHNLSITTLRFVPHNLGLKAEERNGYLNELNKSLLDALQKEGEVFLSNAVLDGKYCLRACIVNFRTTKRDVVETIDLIAARGQQLFAAG